MREAQAFSSPALVTSLEILRSETLEDAFNTFIERSPGRATLNQAVLFERMPSDDCLRAAGSLGLTRHQELLYRRVETNEASPITATYWSKRRLERNLDALAEEFDLWGYYCDDEFTQGEFLGGRVLVEPLSVFGMPVGVLLLLHIGHEDLSELKSHLDLTRQALAALLAGAGFCRMWDPLTTNDHRTQGLSLRDRQILVRVEQGLTNAQIADHLTHKLGRHVSESTVRNSLTTIYRKLGASDRHDAAAKARMRGDLAGLR